MKRTVVAMAIAAVLGFVGTSIGVEDKNPLEGVKCFLMPAKAISAEKSVDYKDGKVYFCCPNCVKKFSESKEKYEAKANHQLVLTKQYKQEGCPFSGGKLDDATAIEVSGVKVAFCCNNCKGTAEKLTGDEQINKVFGKESFEKGKFTKVKAEKK